MKLECLTRQIRGLCACACAIFGASLALTHFSVLYTVFCSSWFMSHFSPISKRTHVPLLTFYPGQCTVFFWQTKPNWSFLCFASRRNKGWHAAAGLTIAIVELLFLFELRIVQRLRGLYKDQPTLPFPRKEKCIHFDMKQWKGIQARVIWLLRQPSFLLIAMPTFRLVSSQTFLCFSPRLINFLMSGLGQLIARTNMPTVQLLSN